MERSACPLSVHYQATQIESRPNTQRTPSRARVECSLSLLSVLSHNLANRRLSDNRVAAILPPHRKSPYRSPRVGSTAYQVIDIRVELYIILVAVIDSGASRTIKFIRLFNPSSYSAFRILAVRQARSSFKFNEESL